MSRTRATAPAGVRDARWAVRPMQVGDVPAVAEIEARCHLAPWTPGNFRDSLRAGHLCVVAERDGGILAYAVLMPGAGEAEILNLTVEPGARRHGLGAALLAALVERASGFGAGALWLEVRASNAAALALYRGAGFVESGRRRDYYPAPEGREDALLMRRALDETAAARPAGT